MATDSAIPSGTELMARFGYGARGVVYLLVGGLAVLAALGHWGGTTDSQGALLVLMQQPLGWVWLGIIGVGLGLFALWRLAQSLLDADGLGTTLSMLGRRAGYLMSAFVNAGLAAFAITLALGLGWHSADSGESSMDKWADRLLGLPYGPWLVMATGAGIAGSGIYLIWQGWTVKRVKEFLDIPPDERWWILPAGRIGFAGRGIVFLVVGAFFSFAGFHGNSDEARGLAGALDALKAQPNGWALLGLTAVALMAFGAFGIIQAAYRRIHPPKIQEPT